MEGFEPDLSDQNRQASMKIIEVRVVIMTWLAYIKVESTKFVFSGFTLLIALLRISILLTRCFR